MSNLVKGKLYRFVSLLTTGLRPISIHEHYTTWQAKSNFASIPSGAIFLFLEETLIDSDPHSNRAWRKVICEDLVGWVWIADNELVELTENDE